LLTTLGLLLASVHGNGLSLLKLLHGLGIASALIFPEAKSKGDLLQALLVLPFESVPPCAAYGAGPAAGLIGDKLPRAIWRALASCRSLLEAKPVVLLHPGPSSDSLGSMRAQLGFGERSAGAVGLWTYTSWQAPVAEVLLPTKELPMASSGVLLLVA
jgi:hypothetical protein